MSDVSARALLEKLDLEVIDQDLFRAQNEDAFGGRLFGGQVLAQALAAAQNTLYDSRPCHSLHGYFLRPGRIDTPVVFQVERIRDGKSFTTRRVIGVQRGQAIFSLDASFQIPESGLQHQVEVGSYPRPDQLRDDQEVAAQLDLEEPRKTWMTRERPFQTRSVTPLDSAAGQPNGTGGVDSFFKSRSEFKSSSATARLRIGHGPCQHLGASPSGTSFPRSLPNGESRPHLVVS